MGPTLFSLGQTVATPVALEVLAASETSPTELLSRHQSGDWGEVPQDDARENRRSVERGFRIISSYPVGENGIRGDVLAASHGPKALGKRLSERMVHRLVHKLFH